MRSDTVTKGKQQAPHRSLFNALGLTQEEMDRPLVGIVSSYNEIVPGHMNLDKIVNAVKQGVATDSDVWDFIRAEKLAINPLYDCGYYRIGCIGCPMTSTVNRENMFVRYPTYKAAYMRAFDRMLKEVWRKGKKTVWRNAEDVFHWWLEDGFISGQISFDEIGE